MMKRKVALSAAIVLALAMALMALVGCGGQAQESETTRSVEKLEVAESSVVEIDKDPFYVLLIGNDSRVGTPEISEPFYADGKGCSDTMMLVRVDPATYKLTFVTVPRDTKDYVDGTAMKINERYKAGGADLLIQGVEDLTGVKVRYYVDTTFVGFQDLVNTLGGVDVYVPLDLQMTEIVSGGKLSVSSGVQHLDGAEALILACNRHAYDAYGDIEAYRQSNDRAIAIAMLNKVLADADSAADTAEALCAFVDTNWDVKEIGAYAKLFAENAGSITYLSGTGPYKGDIDAETELWMTYRDPETWAAVMETVNAGGDPNTVLPAPSLQP